MRHLPQEARGGAFALHANICTLRSGCGHRCCGLRFSHPVGRRWRKTVSDRDVTAVLPPCYRHVTAVLPPCYRHVTACYGLLPPLLPPVTTTVTACYRHVTAMLPPRYRHVTAVIYRNYGGNMAVTLR